MNNTTVKPIEKFLPSINVKLDYGYYEHMERYLPTPSHAKIVEAVLDGFIGSGSHAHMMIGPYGTGKSHVATLLTNVVTQQLSKELMINLAHKFQTVNENVYEQLLKIHKQERRYIPVFLSGYEGSLQIALVRAFQKALFNLKLAIPLSGDSKTIETIVTKWQNEFPAVYADFEGEVFSSFNNIEDFWDKVFSDDADTIHWFKDYYYKQTAGADFPISHVKLLEFLPRLLDRLAQKNMGLFLVYDEFGRFMQALDEQTVYQEMEALQDIAEVSERSPHNLQLLFISHQNFNHYAYGFHQDVQKEFKRIEKRFQLTWIESDPNTVVRLAHVLTQEYRPPMLPLNYEQLSSDVIKSGIFTGLTAQEKSELVIKGSYPLHPTTLCILPFIADRVAQNERTLFTFLRGNDPFALPQIYKKTNGWILPEHLFDYFEKSFVDAERSTEIYKQYRLYQVAKDRVSNHPEQKALLRILKTLTLSSIARITQFTKVNEWLLSFMLPDLDKEIGQLLDEFKKLKLVMFRRTSGHYELFEGSDIDIEKLLSNKRKTTNYSRRQRMQFLSQYLLKKYYLARSYNDRKSMTRFATVEPVMATEILEGKITDFSGLVEHHNSDAVIIYVISETAEEIVKVKEFLLNHSYPKQVLFAVAHKPMSALTDYIYNLVNINKMEGDKTFIQQDRHLKEEIETLKQEFILSVQRMLAPFTSFSPEIKWIWSGEEYAISSEYRIVRFLSDVFDNIYPDTPVINNESFNRRKITSVQKRAACKVIDHILYQHEEERLGINGWGPDYLIYATVLKNNNMHDGKNFISLEKTNPYISKLSQEVSSYFQSHPKGEWSSIISLFTSSPYGVRKPVISVLLAAFFHNKWRSIVIRKNNTVINELSGSLFYEIINAPHLYQYEYHKVNEQDIKTIRTIKNVFDEFVFPEEKNIDSPVLVGKVLLRWFNSLPLITQQTKSVGRELRNLFRRVRMNIQTPFELIQGLGDEYSEEFLTELKRKADMFLEEYQHGLGEKVLQATGFSSYIDIQKWAETTNMNTSLLIRLIKSSNTLDNFIVSFIKKNIGVEVKDWSDQTESLFLEQINLAFTEARKNSAEENNERVDTIEINEQQLIRIPKGELRGTSKLIFENINRTMEITGKTLTKEEKKMIYWQLLQEVAQEDDLL